MVLHLKQHKKSFFNLNKNSSCERVIDCHKFIDGTWQKRGHKSANGVATAISKENG